MTITIPSDDLASCVSCGLCLPHCPTFRVTGDESRSPRGRIGVMRGIVDGSVSIDAPDVLASMETCVQCRGCETACPSAVPFGSMMTATRVAIASGPRRRRSWWMSIGFRLLAVGWFVWSVTRLAAIGQRCRVVPSRRLGLPRRLPLRRPELEATGTDVWVFTGCVMDAWQRDVHVDVVALATATGNGVALPRSGGCCGALAEHAGLDNLAARQAARTVASMPGNEPILVDSAGCGAMMKGYDHLLGTPEATAFAARVVDVNEWLVGHLDALPPVRPDWARPTVAVQDPCHLRHVQRAHLPTRTVLDAVATVVELDDDGLCCGAGGAFSVVQPDLADEIRTRKVAAIGRSNADLVASANPGCSTHLSWSGLGVRHPVSIVADAVGLRGGRRDVR